MEIAYKENDTVYFVILIKGRASLQGQVFRKPYFLAVEGKVASIYKPTKVSIPLLSIQVPKWPLRYLIEPEHCFKTQEDANKVATEKTAKLG
jgi:uncharacterized protein (UPF0333 family)